MSAQKKVRMEAELRMIPDCHPLEQIQVLYVPSRGGDEIRVKCSFCYRVFFRVKLPKEDA